MSFLKKWLWLVCSHIREHTHFPNTVWKPRVSPSSRDPWDSVHPLTYSAMPGQELCQPPSTEICPVGLTRRFFIRPCPLMSRKCPCPIPNCEANAFLASGPLRVPLPLMVGRYLPSGSWGCRTQPIVPSLSSAEKQNTRKSPL